VFASKDTVLRTITSLITQECSPIIIYTPPCATGISGLGAAWLLSQDPSLDVTVFEQNNYVGGHTNTVTVEKCKTVKGDVVEKDIPVDTGFIGK
jgi:ribulose 1,5-bisphosphate synthetase/thiazole synthase